MVKQRCPKPKMGVRSSPGMPKQAPPALGGVALYKREITAGAKLRGPIPIQRSWIGGRSDVAAFQSWFINFVSKPTTSPSGSRRSSALQARNYRRSKAPRTYPNSAYLDWWKVRCRGVSKLIYQLCQQADYKPVRKHAFAKLFRATALSFRGKYAKSRHIYLA